MTVGIILDVVGDISFYHKLLMFSFPSMEYNDLINISQDAFRYSSDPVEAVAALVAGYCVENEIDINVFNWDAFFLAVEVL